MMTLHDVAAAPIVAAQQSSSSFMPFLFLALTVVAFYFFLIRPQRNRQRQQQALLSQVAPGARVMTTSGLYGTVVEVDGDDIILEIAPGVEARFLKQAIMRTVSETDAEDETDSAVDEDESAGDVHDVDEGVAPAEPGRSAEERAEAKAEEKSSSKPSA
jgi:preprotein translocase subunit YajC